MSSLGFGGLGANRASVEFRFQEAVRMHDSCSGSSLRRSHTYSPEIKNKAPFGFGLHDSYSKLVHEF